MDFLNDFGIKPILLAAQIVNFFILLLILKKFLYGPILKILEERKRKIAQSLENAAEIEKKLAETEAEKEKKIEKATIEARKIIAEATVSANQIIEEAHLKAEVDIKQMIIKSEAQIQKDRELMQQEIRAHLADLVALGMQKIAGKILSDKDKKDLTAKSIKDFRSN